MALPGVSFHVPLSTVSPTMSIEVNITGPGTSEQSINNIVFVALWIIIMVTGIIGNSLIFLALAVSRSLQKRSNILVVNVLIADVVVCCLLPLQSATLLLADNNSEEGVLSSSVCVGVAILASMCLWSRMATFGVLSHQQWKQHTKSRSLWASIHKRKRPLIVASLTWVFPLIIILVLRIVTGCVQLVKTENSKETLCIFKGCDESQLILRIVTPILWLLAVLFSLRNYYRIHIYEKNRKANKYVPRKKRRPNPRRDPEAYMTPKSPFEEVQLARPVTSVKKGKGKPTSMDSDQDTCEQAKVSKSKSPKFLDFSRGKGNKSKQEKQKILGSRRDDRLMSNPGEVKTIDKELRMMFSRKQEHINSETGTFRPSTIQKNSEKEESQQDKSEIDERNDKNQDRNSGKIRLKLNSFVKKIPWKKSSTETMISDVSQEDNSDNDYMDDLDDDEVINEMVMGDADDSTSMKLYSSPNYNVNKTRMHEGDQSIPSFELQLVGSSRISSRRSSRKKSSPPDFVLSVSQLLSLLTLLYLVLILPKLICPLLPSSQSCSHIIYKLAETIYVLLSAINPILLAVKHQTFSLVITGLVYRRWKSIPQPSSWIVRLCKIEENTNAYGDNDIQL